MGPSAGSAASSLTVDDERQMAALLSELDRQPLPGRPAGGSDGPEDEYDEDDDEGERQQQRTRLGDIALFAQPDAFTDTLQRVYESDERMMADRQRSDRRTRRLADRLSSAMSASTAGLADGSSYYSELPPAPVDIDMDVDTYDAQGNSAEVALDDGSTTRRTYESASDSQHEANVAALSHHSDPTPPANKRKRQSAAFAFSSHNTSDTARHSAAVVSPTSSAANSGSGSAALTGLLSHPARAAAADDTVASVLSSSSSSAPLTANKPSCLLASSAPKSVAAASPIAADSSLLFYYYDAYEEPLHTAGTVYLFGKALLAAHSATASCCIHVAGVQRNLFILPRQFALADASDETSATDEPVSFNDVYNEVRAIMADYRVKAYKVKRVQRHYCFDRDLPASQQAAASLLSPSDGVPESTHYLKLVYPFSDRALPRDIKGRTFSRVFGTRTSALELVMLKRQLMGPAWLRIDGVQSAQSALSWCRFEYRIDSSKQLQLLVDAPEAPLMSLMALSLQSVRSDKTGRDELVAVSLLVHHAVSVEANSADNVVSVETAVCGLSGQPLPSDWPLAVKSHNKQHSNRQLLHCANERAMLAWLISRIGNIDPDALLAHDLHGFVMDLLMSRLAALKVPHWSKVGRLKRLQVPNIDRSSAYNASVLDRGVGSGRLMVDTQLLAKEFLPGQRMYTLQHLVDSQLGHDRRKDDMDHTALSALLGRSTDLLRLVDHNELDCALVLSLMSRMQLLPLTKQLTNLAGNTWSRTLRSVRSERVEWLLLHEFHQLKFIIPEKYTKREREKDGASRGGGSSGGGNSHVDEGPTAEDDDDNTVEKDSGGHRRAGAGKAGKGPSATVVNGSGSGAPKSASRRRGKPLYSGGLVLEPKRGFYDRFILLLDFNSLYPSIIQEFNICFTTVKPWTARTSQQQPHTADGGPQPSHESSRVGETEDAEATAAVASANGGAAPIVDLPDQSLPQGHLPRVLHLLVARRREVKRLLATASEPSRRAQLDIRQKALKLVANSMYGCLGFVNSRFYSPHIAALITSQGRDILSSSVDLCAAIGANVIYGDTDSIMIDTGVSVMEQALTLGQAIKREINKKHRVLEIDIDGVYRNMLLLRKKKYAALKVADAGKGAGKQYVREVKGLDMVRRDWCGLSKEVSSKVLNFLLSDKQRDDVVESVVLALDAVGKAVRALEVPLDLFVVTKQLTKPPSEYSDAHSQPHVQVALAMIQNGDKVRSGDIVPYVVCKGDGPVPKRCYHPSTVMAASGGLAVDVDYYLEYQVMPPVARLCAVMEELDQPRIAACLGLDHTRFRHAVDERSGSADWAGRGGGNDDDELLSLSAVHGEPEQRFRDCQRLKLTCTHCQQTLAFDGAVRLLNSPDASHEDAARAEVNADTGAGVGGGTAPPLACSGLQCTSVGCAGLLGDGSDEQTAQTLHSLQAALRTTFHRSLVATYTGGTQCSDSACRLRSRDASMHPSNRCLRDKCQGHSIAVQPASRLYVQLLSMQYELDAQRQLDKAAREHERRQAEKEAAQAASLSSSALSSSTSGGGPSQLAASILKADWSCPAERELLPLKLRHVLGDAQAEVTELLQQSAYHFVPPLVFRLSA